MQDDTQTGTGDSQVSQDTPTESSQLTTPQADQPVPNETERTGEGQTTQSEAQPTDGSTAESNADGASEQGGVNFDDPFRKGDPLPERDQISEEDQRQRDLAAQRQEHNARTGGAEISGTDLADDRQAHNDRVGGGSVPGTSDSSDDAPQGD